MQQAVEAWWKLFGIGPWLFYTYGKPPVKSMSYRGRQVDYSIRIALSWIGLLRSELIEPQGGLTVYADFVKEHGFGMHRFGVLVENMKEGFRMAAEAGPALTMDGAGLGLEGDGHYA